MAEYRMSDEARAARAAYLKAWRKNNPAKQREYDARTWEKKAAALRAQKLGENGKNSDATA